MRKIKTLYQATAEVFQGLALLCCFDAFGNQIKVKLFGKPDGRFDDGMHHGVINVLGKLFIEFDHIKGQYVQAA